MDGIYDIHSIPSPPLSTLELTVLSLLLVFLVAIIIYIINLFVFSQKAKAKRQIRLLNKKFNNNEIKSHDAVYKLCNLLSNGLDKNKIGLNTSIPEKVSKDTQRWNKFTIALSNSRYNNNTINSHDLESLFQESLYWLKR